MYEIWDEVGEITDYQYNYILDRIRKRKMTNIEILKQAIALDKKLNKLIKKLNKDQAAISLLQIERDKLQLLNFKLWEPYTIVKIGHKPYFIIRTDGNKFSIQEIKVEKL